MHQHNSVKRAETKTGRKNKARMHQNLSSLTWDASERLQYESQDNVPDNTL